VGGTAALAFAGMAGLFTQYGFRPWYASCLAYVFVLPFAYLAQKRLAFKSDAAHRVALPKYVSTQILAFVLSACFSKILFGMIAINPYLGFALISSAVAVMNYFILELWTFVDHE